jgi:hypothetical protein
MGSRTHRRATVARTTAMGAAVASTPLTAHTPEPLTPPTARPGRTPPHLRPGRVPYADRARHSSAYPSKIARRWWPIFR